MSHGSFPVTIKDVPEIVSAKPMALSSGLKMLLGAFVVIGLAAFVLGLAGGDPRKAWIALHVNFMFWLCLAAASSCFVAVFHICNAEWSRPIRRLFDSALPFFTVSPLVLVVLSFGADHLFVWTHNPPPLKAFWLQSWFVYGRDVIALSLLVILARKAVGYSLRRDIGAIRSGLTGVAQGDVARWSSKEYDSYVEGWGADARSEIKRTDDRLGRLSPVLIMIYALSMSLVAFDQIMSVDPHWFSTMFGGFVFMGAVYVAVAMVCFRIVFARKLHPLFTAKIHRSTLHDVGKLLFGFGIFWAYLFWSHYLPIWYGNMPEETGWIITRLRAEPWHGFAWFVLATCFIVPFLLGLSRDVKQVPVLLFGTASIVLVGIWLQHYLLFVPSIYPNEIPLNLIDIGVCLGFAGAFFLSSFRFLEKVPLMPFGDFYIPVAPHSGTDLTPEGYSPTA